MVTSAPSKAARLAPSRERPLRLTTWTLRHLQAFFSTLGQLTRQPVSTLLTAAVIGIALALPFGLQVGLSNVQDLARGWDATADVSLYLHHEVGVEDARALAAELTLQPGIESTRIITPAEALAEYRRMSGFAEALDALEEDNPLPSVVVLRLAKPSRGQAWLKGLVDELGRRPEVDLAQFDLHWLRRLQAMVRVLERGTLVLAALLALAVMLVVGNTIRLGIDNRRDEIEIAKLFGATDAFIRRPFLWNGVVHGLGGALLAWLLVRLSVSLLAGPVGELAVLYGSSFELTTLDATASLALLAAGVGLGLAGSWLAVGRHLGAIEPT